MTAIQMSTLNAEILQNLGVIAENESVLARVAKYLRKVAREITNDPTKMTKEEFFAKVDKAKAQYQRGEYTTLLPGESVTDMLKRCGYDI